MYDYVMSGTGFTKLGSKKFLDGELAKILAQLIKKVNSVPNHKFSFLYNSFTETDFGRKLKEACPNTERYADSGGLQIVTKGAIATPEVKRNVYKNQAEFSRYGMCFDEIPLKLIGDRSAIGDTSGRLFDHSVIKERAEATGRNLIEQIEIYLKMNSSCRPIAIMHGNCYDTFMQWSDYMLAVMPQDMRDMIAGVALSSASLGSGLLLDVERAMAFHNIQLNVKHLHLLGVGAIKRLVPFAVLNNNGMFPEDTIISYDSTTHTRGIHFGQFHPNGKLTTREIPKDRNTTAFEIIVKDLSEWVHVNEDELWEAMTISPTKQLKAGKDDMASYKYVALLTFKSIYNFMMKASETIHSNEKMLENYGGLEYHAIRTLMDVKTYSDYALWYKHIGPHLNTTRINSQVSTLDEFFA